MRFCIYLGMAGWLGNVNAHAIQTETLPVSENDFDTTGDGFHRFVDPQDGAAYVYTNFEPFQAHRLFPGLDQPDIKGSPQVRDRLARRLATRSVPAKLNRLA